VEKFFNKFKINSKEYLKTNILFISYVILSLVNAILLRFFTVGNYFEIKPVLADLSIILLIGSIGYFIKPKNQFKYFFTWNVIFTATCTINSLYYTNYLSYASFSLIATSLQIVDVADAVTENILEIKDFIYLLSPLILIVVHTILKKKEYYDKVSKIEIGKVSAFNTFIGGLICLGIFLSMLTAVDISRLNKQ